MKKKLIDVGKSLGVTLSPTALEIFDIKKGYECDIYPDMNHFVKTKEKRFIVVFKSYE